jgi:hypothetical protein
LKNLCLLRLVYMQHYFLLRKKAMHLLNNTGVHFF